MSAARRDLTLYLALAALTLGLGLSRFWVGPWYHTYRPPEVSLLQGWPASWEVQYYTDELPNFLGNQPPGYGIAPVHYRTFTTLYLTTLLVALTGSAYWPFPAVDLFFWWLAGLATYHLAQRLRTGRLAAALSAFLVVASPLLVSHMWRQDLHPANFASLALGCWAAVTLIDEHRSRLRLAMCLTFLLVLMSLSYQYQWVMVPLLYLLATRHPGLGFVWSGVIVVAATAGYVAATAGIEALFTHAVSPATVWNNVASQPGSMIGERLRGVHSLAGLLAQFPSAYYQEEVVRSYHPWVLAAGAIGVVLLGPRVTLAALVGTGISLVSITFYSAPWAATNAYPFIYIGAGTACAALGRLVTRMGARSPVLSARAALPGYTAAAAAALFLAAQTNLDLVGNTDFLLTWWRYFGGHYLF